jgi:hypothetical protein
MCPSSLAGVFIGLNLDFCSYVQPYVFSLVHQIQTFLINPIKMMVYFLPIRPHSCLNGPLISNFNFTN